MGVIFQFYIVAKLFYKGIEKNSILTLIISILFTIGSKTIIFQVLSNLGREGTMLFIYGRQLPTALDNFILGMFICHFIKKNDCSSRIKNILYSVSGLFLLIIALILAEKNMVYSNSLFGYSWHTLLAVSLSLLFLFFLQLKIKESRIVNWLNFIAKYEYGIYLWHLLVINNLVANAPIINQLVSRGYLFSYIIIFILSIGISLLLSIIFNDSLSNKKLKATR